MGTIEILIPELIVILFLVLPLLRPFLKKLWPLEGLIWLPPIALGILIGIFPAYGFRPECLPMLVFALIFNIANVPSLFSSVTSRPNDSFYSNKKPLLTVFIFILLGVVAIPMFVFPPRIYEKPENETLRVVEINNKVFKVYGDEPAAQAPAVGASRPVIFIFPPEIGSVATIDFVCTELQKKGFTVVTYSYNKSKPLAHWRIFRRGTAFASVNEQGKTLEAERRAEIESVMALFPSLLGYTRNADLPPILLVGYGTGGSALAYLAGERRFVSRYNNVMGVVAIESRLWNSYLPEVRELQAVPTEGGIIQRHWMTFVGKFKNLKPLGVTRTGSLPNAGLPVLHLVSGKALDTPKEQRPYQAVIDSIRSSSGPVAFAAIEGAGPLDYQDFPFTHPIYSFLLPGLKGAKKSANPMGDTATIVGNFASHLLEQSEQTGVNIPPRYSTSGRLYVESKGLSAFRL